MFGQSVVRLPDPTGIATWNVDAQWSTAALCLGTVAILTTMEAVPLYRFSLADASCGGFNMEWAARVCACIVW